MHSQQIIPSSTNRKVQTYLSEAYVSSDTSFGEVRIIAFYAPKQEPDSRADPVRYMLTPSALHIEVYNLRNRQYQTVRVKDFHRYHSQKNPKILKATAYKVKTNWQYPLLTTIYINAIPLRDYIKPVSSRTPSYRKLHTIRNLTMFITITALTGYRRVLFPQMTKSYYSWCSTDTRGKWRHSQETKSTMQPSRWSYETKISLRSETYDHENCRQNHPAHTLSITSTLPISLEHFNITSAYLNGTCNHEKPVVGIK